MRETPSLFFTLTIKERMRGLYSRREGNFSIISDYLGTPVEAYDKQGNQVWSAKLDIYRRIKRFTGERDFIPFRYQGSMLIKRLDCTIIDSVITHQVRECIRNKTLLG